MSTDVKRLGTCRRMCLVFLCFRGVLQIMKERMKFYGLYGSRFGTAGFGFAFFSSTETAFTSANKIRLKSLASAGNKRAALALKILDDYDTLLSTILIGNNIVNIVATSLATVLFTKWLGGEFGVTVSTVVMTVVVLIFGEITPKSLAKEVPEKFAMFAAPIMRFLSLVLTPLNALFSGWKKLLRKLFHFAGEQTMTEEELMTMIDEVEQEGVLDENESDLLRSAIEFNDVEVEDILTHRVDMIAIDIEDSMEEMLQAFRENPYSGCRLYPGNGRQYYRYFA